MTIVSIRQPGYLPFSGFFKKIQSSDVFVFLDDVQFEKNDWDNRNKIRTSNGSMWLTIPVMHKFGQRLNEVKIDNNKNWNRKHLNALKLNYSNAPFFSKYWGKIESILEQRWEVLIDLNYSLIDYFISELNLPNKTIKSSDLKINASGSEKLLKICQKLNTSIYLSGELGKNYLNEKIFANANIKIIYEKFEHPTYNQIYGKFIPNMSIIDLLFNEGPNALEIIKNTKNF